jgi:molecular chaperone DnaK (HSP70)
VKTSVVSTANGVRYIPSLAIVDPSDASKFVVGETAKSTILRTKSSAENKGEVIFSTKASIHNDYSASTTTEFFKEIQAMTKGAVGENSRVRAVVSVPAANNADANATLLGAIKNGFTGDDSIMAVVQEPVAVCIANGLTSASAAAPKGWKNALVVSWGASGLVCTEVKRVGGADAVSVGTSVAEASVGGEVIVDALVTHCANMFERKNKLSVFDSKKAVGRLRLECETAIRTLAKAASVTIDIDGLVDGVDLKVPLSKPRFDMLAAAAVGKARETLEAFAKGKNFDVVLKSGAVCMMPGAVALLTEVFPEAWHGLSNVPADEAAVIGAATHASFLTEADQCEQPQTTELTATVAVASGISVGVAKLAGDAISGDAAEVIGEGSPVELFHECVVDFEEEGGVVGVVDLKTKKILAKIGDLKKGRNPVFLALGKQGGIVVKCGDAEGVIA